MKFKYRTLSLALLSVSSVMLSGCNGGTSSTAPSNSTTDSAVQVRDYSEVTQYATPTSSCFAVTNQNVDSTASVYHLGTSFTLKNTCDSNQDLNNTIVIMSSDLSNLTGGFSIYSTAPWFGNGVSTQVVDNAQTGRKELAITLKNMSNTSVWPAVPYVTPGSTVDVSFGYAPGAGDNKPAELWGGAALGKVTFSAGSVTPPPPAQPGSVGLTLDTKALKSVCVEASPCNIPLYLSNNGSGTALLVDTLKKVTTNSMQYKLESVVAGNYSFTVDSNTLPKGIQFIPGASSFVVRGGGNVESQTAQFSAVVITTGNIQYSIVAPKQFSTQQSDVSVVFTKSGSNPLVYTTKNAFTTATVNNVEKGTYTLTTPNGLADAIAGKYSAPLKKGSIVVTAESTTVVDPVAFGNKNSDATVNVVVTGLDAGQSASLKLTDNLAGVSYLFNDVTLTSAATEAKPLPLKLLATDNVLLSVTAPAGYKAVSPINTTVVNGSKITINFEKEDVNPIPPGALPLVNKSSFFLHLQSNTPNQTCPKLVEPGQSTYAMPSQNGDWAASCYYLVCSSKDYEDGPGCLEKTPDGQMNQGGYLAWINLNPKTGVCGLPGYDAGTNSFTCAIDTKTGAFTFDFKAVTQKYSAGSQSGQVVTYSKAVPTTYSNAPGLKYRGVNISGLEYDGTLGDAMYQRSSGVDFKYFAEQGMNTVRLPIRGEYVIADDDGKGYYNLITHTRMSSSGSNKVHLNTMYLAGLKDTVSDLLSKKVNVIIDLHGYLRDCPTGSNGVVDRGQRNEPTDPPSQSLCKIITADDMSYVWNVLATEFKPLAQQYNINSSNQLIFGLQNEPFSDAANGAPLKTQDVFDIEVAGAKAIRAAGLNNRIIFSGNYWDPLHGLVDFVPNDGAADPVDIAQGNSNGKIFTKARLEAAGIDVSGIAYEAHQYFDSNYSGRYEQCNVYANYEDFKTKLDLNAIGKWMDDNHMQVMLSEFGAANNATCQTDLGYMMQFLEEHALGQAGQTNGGFTGWQLWRANRHNSGGYGYFNYLDKANYNVYGGNGTKPAVPDGTGINEGPANPLMDSLYFKHLTHI